MRLTMKISFTPSPKFLCCALAPLAIFLLVFGPVPTAAHAQGLGSIVGTVVDPSGAAVAGAQVTATHTGTGFNSVAVTNSSGEYVLPSLPPAVYNISVSSSGFSSFVQSGITLQQVNQLPLNGRNAAALTTLVAGVVQAPSAYADQGNTKTYPVAVTISANGTRANQTSYLLDGGNNNDEYTQVNAPFPFPDALQEFSVQTSNYSAEYGQNAGAVVNVITKSGTNKFHGDLFEFVRNRVLTTLEA